MDLVSESRTFFRHDRGCELGCVSHAAIMKNSPGFAGMRIFGHYAFALLLRGSGHYKDANGFECDLKPGNLMWVFPDLPHHYGPHNNTTWDEIFFVFRGPIFDCLKNEGTLDRQKPVDFLQPLPYWFNRFCETAKFYMIPGQERSVKAITQLLSLIADIRLHQKWKSSKEVQWLEKAGQLLEANSSLADVAKQMNCSYETFRKQFTERSGLSPKQFQIKRRLEISCDLLHEGRTVKEVADVLGFTDEFYYSKLFRKTFGCSPSQYKSTPMFTSPKATESD